jgi:hypothetical protein
MNGKTQSLALLTNTTKVPFSNLLPVAAAIQKQLDGEFLKAWSAHGSITAWENPDTLPTDYAPIFICNTISDPRLAGFHSTTDQKPYANVLYNPAEDWSIDVSHEALEIVVDPEGKTLQSAPSPIPEQGQVDFLVEICDPPGRNAFYWIDNVKVADFCLKNYFDPTLTPGTICSQHEALTAAFQILPGGYLTWRDSTGQWWEQHNLGYLLPPEQIDPPNIGASLREQIDMITRPKLLAFSQKAKKGRRRGTVKEAQARKSSANKIRRHTTWLQRQLKAFDAQQGRKSA